MFLATCHKINMQRFCDDLVHFSFVLSSASTVSDLFDEYMHDLGCLLDRYAPVICEKKTCRLVARFIL